MAKSKSSKTSHLTSAGRDVLTSVANRDPLSTLLLPRPTLSPLRLDILALEDRRLWHPERQNRPFAAAPRQASRPVARQRPAFHQPSQTRAIIAFQEPSRVAVCVRRGIRREVLHALGVAGKRGLGGPHRNEASTISCTRRK